MTREAREGHGVVRVPSSRRPPGSPCVTGLPPPGHSAGRRRRPGVLALTSRPTWGSGEAPPFFQRGAETATGATSGMTASPLL